MTVSEQYGYQLQNNSGKLNTRDLQVRISDLEREIDKSLVPKKTLMKSKKETMKSKKKKKSLKKKDDKLCIFNKCPTGSYDKDHILNNQIQVANGNLCTFDTCPTGSVPIGWMVSDGGLNRSRLCTFKTCPKGSRELAHFIKPIKTKKSKKTL